MADATGDPFGEPQDEPENNALDAPPKLSGGVVSGLIQSRVERFKGAEAASIGIVLGGCIAAGFFGGLWLDNRFGTNYWMPIGFLFGVVAGFRELFHTIRRLNQRAQSEREALKQKNAGISANMAGEYRKAKGAPLTEEVDIEETESTRLFSVPPPPTASFEVKPAAQNHVSKARVESLEEMTQRLLDEGQEQGEKHE